MPLEIHTQLQNELEAGLMGLEARNQRRSLAELGGVNLCSNNYLGLAQSAALKATVPEGKARLRFSLTVEISEANLARLHSCLDGWRERCTPDAGAARA